MAVAESAGSRSDITKMIKDLKAEARYYGLTLHVGKTNVMTNCLVNRPASLDCDGQTVKVLDTGSAERYLGRQLAVENYHQAELANRIAVGWKAFFKFKATLCNRNLALHLCIKLFESVVTPCVLYACGSWTMKGESENLLRTTRRKMLRWMVRVGRNTDEDWVQFIGRLTNRSEELASYYGANVWVDLQRLRKRRLAGQTARRSDGRWSTRLLSWRPWFRLIPRRNVGRPRTRWEDDVVKIAGETWNAEAKNLKLWEALSTGYEEKLF